MKGLVAGTTKEMIDEQHASATSRCLQAHAYCRQQNTSVKTEGSRQRSRPPTPTAGQKRLRHIRTNTPPTVPTAPLTHPCHRVPDNFIIHMHASPLFGSPGHCMVQSLTLTLREGRETPWKRVATRSTPQCTHKKVTTSRRPAQRGASGKNAS